MFETPTIDSYFGDIVSYNRVYALNPSSFNTFESEEDIAMSSLNGTEINDKAIVSEAAMRLYKDEQALSDNHQKQDSQKHAGHVKKNASNIKSEDELSDNEKRELEKMKQRDQEVKVHEQAHQSAAGNGVSASAPSYGTKKGPDGKEYAVEGEVRLSFRETDDMQSNIRKAETMKRAALAPAEPSDQDLAVARDADSKIARYKRKLQEQEQETKSSSNPSSSSIIGSESNSKSDSIFSKEDKNSSFEFANEPKSA